MRDINPDELSNKYCREFSNEQLKTIHKLSHCELCDKELTEDDDKSDNLNRCIECYEEWGDSWPDK
jgi:hypothetical protein